MPVNLESLNHSLEELNTHYHAYRNARMHFDKIGNRASTDDPKSMEIYNKYILARSAYKGAHLNYKAEFRKANEYKRL